MGTWGVGLFSDDTAADVRSHYRELIEDGVEDAEATQRVVEHFREYLDDEDDGPIPVAGAGRRAVESRSARSRGTGDGAEGHRSRS